MTFRTSALTAALLGASGLLATGAWAQGAQHLDGPYIGLYGGQSRARLPVDGLVGQQLSAPLLPYTSVTSGRDESDMAYRLFAGYQFNRYFGMELGYSDLGRFGISADTVPTGRLDGRVKVRTAGVDLVGTLPLVDQLDFIWRVGAQRAQVDGRYSGTDAVQAAAPSTRSRGWGAKFGAGLQLALMPGMLLRAEAEQVRVPDTIGGHMRVRTYGLSLVWPLGRESSPRYASAPAPAYTPTVAAAPMPTPPPRIVAVAPPPAPKAPPPPVTRRVSFTAESLFGFDKSTLRPEGQEALDRFSREVAGTDFAVMVVEGHADRLGDADYNQRLSQERAEVVKAYLVRSGGFAPDKISAMGKGEGTPVTQMADCKANLPTTALRACLQPDRRVDVDVTGTR
jgi:OOP family OmpA-OmpF porin